MRRSISWRYDNTVVSGVALLGLETSSSVVTTVTDFDTPSDLDSIDLSGFSPDVSGSRYAWVGVEFQDPQYFGGQHVYTRVVPGPAAVRADADKFAPSDQTDPLVGTTMAAWLDNRAYSVMDTESNDLYKEPVGGGGESLVATDVVAGHWGSPAISGDNITYMKWHPGADALDIYATDLSSSATTLVASMQDWNTMDIGIGGDWVVWSNKASDSAPSLLKAKNVKTGQARLIYSSTAVWRMGADASDGLVSYTTPDGKDWIYDCAAGTRRAAGPGANFTSPDEGRDVFSWAGSHFGLMRDFSQDWDTGSYWGALTAGNMFAGPAFVVDSYAGVASERALAVSGNLMVNGRELYDMRSGLFVDPGFSDSWEVHSASVQGDHAAWGIERPSAGQLDAYLGDLSGLPQPPTSRLAGATRFETAVALSHEVSTASTVVIATGRGFADALAGTPLAYALDAPMLLVEPGSIPTSVSAEITRLGATKAVVLGGTGAVSGAVETQLRGLGVTDIRRLAGVNRYETARLVAAELKTVRGGGALGTAFVATGFDFPDAVAAGSVAARLGMPILLTPTTSLAPATTAALASVGATHTVVLGGISNAVVSALPSPVRLAGANRYATARLIADYGLAHGMAADELVLASGRDFPDALAAGGFAARHDSALLPIDGLSSTLPTQVSTFITAHKATLSQVWFVGGEGALPIVLEQRVAEGLR